MHGGDAIQDVPVDPPVGGGAKRAMDLAIAAPLLAVSAPVMLAVAAWVRFDSPGPAIFRQERVGLHGKTFNLLKFRSMVVGAQTMGAGLAVTAGDSRITKVGKVLRRLSLDELPQLINVVRGDMSLVGPRPTVPSQVEHYTDRQRQRLLARPGITGHAQVTGRNAIPWSQRIELDLDYVDCWSLRRDILIIARTALVVLGRKDTYRGESGGGFDLPLRTPGPTSGDTRA